MIEHEFTETIRAILVEGFGESQTSLLLASSELLKYINTKTRSANRGSKARGSFGSLYAIYVLVEDYIKGGFDENPGTYESYEGARFGALLDRQRELPFGSKLQNHALNHRVNNEFAKYFPTSDKRPIIRDTEMQRYWFDENLLTVPVVDGVANIAAAVIEIVHAYIDAKQGAFRRFMVDCDRVKELATANPEAVSEFLYSLMRPNVDARIFEVVSFAILKAFYGDQRIFWGWTPEELTRESLTLYKTGRTNANDGGIDFVMRPLGRFSRLPRPWMSPSTFWISKKSNATRSLLSSSPTQV